MISSHKAQYHTPKAVVNSGDVVVENNNKKKNVPVHRVMKEELEVCRLCFFESFDTFTSSVIIIMYMLIKSESRKVYISRLIKIA